MVTTLRIKDLYRSVIQEIMQERGVQSLPWNGNFDTPVNATLVRVLQYTHMYLVAYNNIYPIHARYDNCYNQLYNYNPIAKRQAQVDIGFGAGIFSWVFLDWASSNGISFDHVSLYGLERTPAMLDLANIARTRLSQNMPDYPEALYTTDSVELLRLLTDNHQSEMDYIVTFGFVLLQAYEENRNNIQSFAEIIAHIARLSNTRCTVLGVDARGQRYLGRYLAAWSALWQILEHMGFQREIVRDGYVYTVLLPPNDSR